MSDATEAMRTDNRAPTAPLDEFLHAYDEDDNEWWRIDCGHHLNLFDEAIDRMREAERNLKAARLALAACREVQEARA